MVLLCSHFRATTKTRHPDIYFFALQVGIDRVIVLLLVPIGINPALFIPMETNIGHQTIKKSRISLQLYLHKNDQ